MRCVASTGPTKKTPVARERDTPKVQARRAEFVDTQPKLDSKRLIFLDESGFRLGSPPRYGWAPKGIDAPGKGSHGAWKTMTMIGAMALDGFRGFVTIDVATSGEVFREFVRQELVPSLRPDDLIVMDNLAAHRDHTALTLIRKAGADVLFLPPYSPEYNPIEKAWGKLKDFVRKLQTLTREAFDKAVAAAMNVITPDDIRGWTQHAGYALNS